MQEAAASKMKPREWKTVGKSLDDLERLIKHRERAAVFAERTLKNELDASEPSEVDDQR